MHAKLLQLVQLFETLWNEACQAPLSMEFSRNKYWSRLPFPSPEDLPDQGQNPCLLHFLHWQAVSLPLMPLILRMVMYMFQCYSLKSSHPSLLPLSPKVCSSHVCPLCCPACNIVSTVFLNSIYMHQYTIFIFLFLIYFTLYDRLWVHPPH